LDHALLDFPAGVLPVPGFNDIAACERQPGIMLPTVFSKLSPGKKQEADALGFAFLRVFYSGVLLLELRQLFLFEALIFPGGILPPTLVKVLLVAWSMVLCFLMAGWLSRPAAVVNYLISVVVVWAMPDFKYPFDYLMISVNFLLIWLPVSATFSLDADWRRRKTGFAAPERVSGGWVYLVALLPLGLVYLDAVFYKFTSPMWTSGLGFWLPASLPQHAQTDLTWILNQQGLVQTIGYGMMVFECAFLLLIWFPRLRLLLVGGGLLLHAGSGLAFPLPHFSLTMMVLYLPLLPAGFWQALRRAWRRFIGGGRYPAAAASASSPLIAIKRADWLTAFLLYCCLGQLLCLTLTPLFQKTAGKLGLSKELSTLQWVFKPVFFFNRTFLGLVPHDIFPDEYFQDYHQLVSLWYVPAQGLMVPLPLLDGQGRPAAWCAGRIYSKWVCRVTGPDARRRQLADGLKSFTAFWMGQQLLSRDKAAFQVVVKEVAVPRAWQPNHLKKQMRQPWQVAGTVRWQGGRCYLELPGL
jgi:hypothetical protein